MSNIEKINKKFVRFGIPSGPFSALSKVIQPLDKFDIQTLNIPDDAITFDFVEAKSLKDAKKVKGKDVIGFHFGSKEDVITTQELRTRDELFGDFIANMNEEVGCKRVLDLGFGRMIGLHDQDVVIDRETREVTVIPPDNRLGL